MKHYSNFDSGAPILTQDPSSFRNLLKRILVDGYGSGSPIGWDLHSDSDYITIFKMKDKTLFIVNENANYIFIRGCIDLDPLNPSSNNDPSSRMFPTIFQQDFGMKISKEDLLGSWTAFGGDLYLYFLIGNLFIFFGQWEDFDRSRNQAIICSKSFGNIIESTLDHYTAFNPHGMFYPTLIGKKTFFLNTAGVDFSKIYLYDSLRGCTIGTLPNLYVSQEGFTFNEEQYLTTMGKNLLCKIFNGSHFFFDLNG